MLRMSKKTFNDAAACAQLSPSSSPKYVDEQHNLRKHIRKELEQFTQNALHQSLEELRANIGKDVSGLLQNCLRATAVAAAANPYLQTTSIVEPQSLCTAPAEPDTFTDINDEAMHLETAKLLHGWPKRVANCKVFRSEAARDVALLPKVHLTIETNHKQAKAVYRFADCVNSKIFNAISTVMVVANAILIGVQTDLMARPEHLGKHEPPLLRILNRYFCLVFTVELLLRVAASGCEFFTSPEWRWNVFDMLIVGIQVMEQLCHGIVHIGDITWLRILRLFRVLRIARVLRLVRFLSDLRAMITSLLASLKTAIWALVLLMMVVYIFAIFFTELSTEYRSSAHSADESIEGLTQFFGSLSLSTATLYQSILSGLSWGEATRHLRCISPFMEPFYMMFIATCMLAIMNSITGLFVEQAMLQTQAENDAHIAEQCVELLNSSSMNGGGNDVTMELFLHHANDQEMQDLIKYIDGDLTDPALLFRLIDFDNSGSITPEEFLIGCRRLRGPGRAIDLACVMREQTQIHQSISAQLSSIENKLSQQIAFESEAPD